MKKFGKQLMALVLVLGGGASDVYAQTVVEYIHTDALGTPIAITDVNRNVIERSEYEPFGRLLNRALTDGPGFTGHVQDAATGLTYMQQRYYDAAIGRFLSTDPVSAYENPGANFSRYKYANNNPYRFLDPDGRQAKSSEEECKTAECNRARQEERQRKREQPYSPTVGEKLARNLGWLGDAFKLELSAGFTLGAKAKLGPLKVTFEAGSMSPFGGGATIGDVYMFTEVRHPSASIELGKYAAGYVGKSERSVMGRNGVSYSEEVTEGGWVLGRKQWEANLNDGEVGVKAGAVLIEVDASVDLGKAAVALFYWGDSTAEP